WLDRAGVKTLFETAMRAQTGADLGHYHEDSVAGRLRPGLIRSGDIYSLESWQEAVDVVEVRGTNLSKELVAALHERGITPDSGKIYSIAAPAYTANELTSKL